MGGYTADSWKALGPTEAPLLHQLGGQMVKEGFNTAGATAERNPRFDKQPADLEKNTEAKDWAVIDVILI